MAQSKTSKIEEVVSILSTMEKEMDDAVSHVSDMRRVLLSLARDESEKSKAEVLSETSLLAQEALARIKTDADKEAEKILLKSEDELKALKTRIDKSFDKAVSLVVKAVLGE